jgi:hypothetical protein
MPRATLASSRCRFFHSIVQSTPTMRSMQSGSRKLPPDDQQTGVERRACSRTSPQPTDSRLRIAHEVANARALDRTLGRPRHQQDQSRSRECRDMESALAQGREKLTAQLERRAARSVTPG